jgi:hypothetical protein
MYFPTDFLQELEEHACEWWISYNYMAGKPGYKNRIEWLGDEDKF